MRRITTRVRLILMKPGVTSAVYAMECASYPPLLLNKVIMTERKGVSCKGTPCKERNGDKNQSGKMR